MKKSLIKNFHDQRTKLQGALCMHIHDVVF